MSVPELRFKEFFSDWNEKKLEDITKEKISYGIVQAGPHIEGGIPYIKSSNVGGLINISQLQCTSSDIHFKYRRSAVHPNDIVFSLRGNIGEVSIVPAEIPEANLTQGTARISVDDLNNNKFVFFQMQTKSFLDRVNERSKGSTFQEISLGDLRMVSLMQCSKAEQTKIGNFLTAVDEKITQLTQKHNLLTKYKKGVMQQIFSQELRFKDDDGGDFPDWKNMELKDVAQINPKTGSLPDEFVYIDLESVEKGVLLKESIIKRENAPSRAQRLLTKGDVLFQMVRPYQGNNLFFNKDGTYVASTGYAQIHAYENASFLYHFLHLESFVAEVINRCTGTSYPAINSSDLATISIQIPVQKEQAKIASFLTYIDDKITITQAQLGAVKQYRQGLLQQMFV